VDQLSPDLTELAPFFEYCHEIDNLRDFTVLNYIGVLKILKKFDKKTGARSNLRQRIDAGQPAAPADPRRTLTLRVPTQTDGHLKAKWAPVLIKQQFYTSTELAALYTKVQVSSARAKQAVVRSSRG